MHNFYSSLLKLTYKQKCGLSDGISKERHFLASILLRFDEDYFSATESIKKMIPNFDRPQLNVDQKEEERAADAALGVSLSIAYKAVSARRNKLPDEDDLSQVDLAVGACYAALLYLSFKVHIEMDNVQMPLRPVISTYIELFTYMSEEQRLQSYKLAEELLKGVLDSQLQNVKEWMVSLIQMSKYWLFSTTSKKRSETDKEAFVFYIGWISGLYAAVNQPNT